ncbi:hypothetical protein N0V90_000448 [Kalmusia sp. IMI 367209]|nr:hypothetical protein N0V90_000448 [Kalmusia sp. IMI 367209]
MLVGADGPDFKVRQQYLPDVKREDLGIGASAGRYLLSEEDLADIQVGTIDGSLNNVVPQWKGWMFVSAWKSRPAHNSPCQEQGLQRCVVWAYFMPQEDTPDALKDHVLQATRGWPHELRSLICDADPFTIKLLSLRSIPKISLWEATKVTVLGDAIHNMTPMAGMGANTALRDSELLTRVLIDVIAGDWHI